ncbi:MAG: DNA-directed RNA polymerase subunit beta' [Oscillospiraceae bacterium]|nr:DNA-directed RNA polymerase subunit beta' [Oscillospiraceae bacterium]
MAVAFDSMKIGLASPKQIRNWSYGAVERPETINYRTQKPEKDGLFCERIFGPQKDWECNCGKYKRIRFKGKICERCGVEVTRNKVRRERMGHIELAATVSHIWYFKGTPSRIGQVLDIPPKRLEEVLYFTKYVVIDKGETTFAKGQLLTEKEYMEARFEHRDDESFFAKTGAEAIKELLSEYANTRYDNYILENLNDFSAITGLSKMEIEDYLAKRERLITFYPEGITEEAGYSKEEIAFYEDEIISRRRYEEFIIPLNIKRRKNGYKIIETVTGSEYIEELFDQNDDHELASKHPKELWKNNLDWVVEELREALETTGQGQKRIKLLKRLDVLEAFRKSGSSPEWMTLDAIPVIPPDIRPMVLLDGGRFATSDLNDLYRRVINRNNRLYKMIELRAPEIIIRNEKRMLQEAVDALIDNGRHGRPVTGPSNRPLKSLSDMLKGKQGRFRQNLLGKRVDYSGRSVIVVGPDLKMEQCGLPKEMAIELFKPFVMRELVDRGISNNIKSARKLVERATDEVWDVLEDVIQDHPVLLNRAPTLHRLGIQAFSPVLVEGRALKLHPLVCTAYNADFDGDQMAVHLPLSNEARREARTLMLAAKNLLKPSDGRPVAVPTQDMILGSYYLTLDKEGEKGEGKLFRDFSEALMAFQCGVLSLHAKIKVRVWRSANGGLIGLGGELFGESSAAGVMGSYGNSGEMKVFDISSVADDSSLEIENDSENSGDFDDFDEYDENAIPPGVEIEPEFIPVADGSDGLPVSGIIETTVGKIIFNEHIPQDLGYVDRTDAKKVLELEINFKVGKSELGKIIDKCIKIHGTATTAKALDKIKDLGFKYSTKAAITVAVCDASIPPEKKDILNAADSKVDEINGYYNQGFISNFERKGEILDVWNDATNQVSDKLTNNLDQFNPIYMMADSGARGSINQIRQLAGMRGLIANTSGETIEIPIRSNYREGLNILEYFISSRGARKGLADTALRTADSGYLTRRLVDVSQEVIIREEDCGTKNGIEVYEIREGKELIEPLEERLLGRYLTEDVKGKKGKKVIVSANQLITDSDAKAIIAAGHETVTIRSVLTCEAAQGVCSKCYGASLADGKPIKNGEAVGIIAAQSIGEPGTQLTMRTFHTGGIASADDITQGLPRVEELFESRRPKSSAIMTEISGTVKFEEIKKTRHVTVTTDDGESKSYSTPFGYRLRVEEGDRVEAGDPLTEGSVNPHDVLAVKGEQAVQNYIIAEVQKVYRLQGVDINDKHIEVIVRQMMRKVRIDEPGDSDLFNTATVDKSQLMRIIDELDKRRESGEEVTMPTYIPMLLGITKASLATDSFLSAASFQETTRVLTEAAIHGKVDPLLGLKENVIIGKLIPAGTGLDN